MATWGGVSRIETVALDTPLLCICWASFALGPVMTSQCGNHVKLSCRWMTWQKLKIEKCKHGFEYIFSVKELDTVFIENISKTYVTGFWHWMDGFLSWLRLCLCLCLCLSHLSLSVCLSVCLYVCLWTCMRNQKFLLGRNSPVLKMTIALETGKLCGINLHLLELSDDFLQWPDLCHHGNHLLRRRLLCVDTCQS